MITEASVGDAQDAYSSILVQLWTVLSEIPKAVAISATVRCFEWCRVRELESPAYPISFFIFLINRFQKLVFLNLFDTST